LNPAARALPHRCDCRVSTAPNEKGTRISITVYFGWVGLSAAGQQVRWALNQDFGTLATADLLDFTAETVDTFFQLAIAALIVMRYRRVAATGGLYPRLVALLGFFLFLLLVPFLSRHELSPTLDFLSILLMLSGSILATVVLLYLGRSFSILPEARRLVVTGPYRFVRHPLYATEMICMLGLVIQFTLWPAVIVFLIQLVIQLERMPQNCGAGWATLDEMMALVGLRSWD
jgi:protein-S-isoprenylcysteine O-methyltransferase Ste14